MNRTGIRTAAVAALLAGAGIGVGLGLVPSAVASPLNPVNPVPPVAPFDPELITRATLAPPVAPPTSITEVTLPPIRTLPPKTLTPAPPTTDEPTPEPETETETTPESPPTTHPTTTRPHAPKFPKGAPETGGGSGGGVDPTVLVAVFVLGAGGVGAGAIVVNRRRGRNA